MIHWYIFATIFSKNLYKSFTTKSGIEFTQQASRQNHATHVAHFMLYNQQKQNIGIVWIRPEIC